VENVEARMSLDRIFFGYMVLVGVVTGAILVAAPYVQNFAIKPYFWILIAVGLFDVAVYAVKGTAPAKTLTMNARLIGFGIGIALIVAIPVLAGSPVRFV
jgi:hypothetical protein